MLPMVTKSKRKRQSKSGGDLTRVRRALEKGDFKTALKEAKVCHRQAPTEASRQLLEEAHLARAEQLQRLGMPAECRAVLEGLLSLGVTEKGVERRLPALLVAVGLIDRAQSALGSPLEMDETLTAAAADHAVRNPQDAPVSQPELSRGARQIRAALDALAAGDEARALDAVREVPRTSPFADWRLFVRGLAAYYRHDTEAMRANWDRLDPKRAAVRIAGTLRLLDEMPAGPGEARQQRQGALDRVERAVFCESLAGPLMRMQDDCAAGRW